MKKINITHLILLIILCTAFNFTLIGANKPAFKTKEFNAINSTHEQIQNGNFETGTIAGWVSSDRITTDVDGITEVSYEVNGELPNTGYSSLHLYARGENAVNGRGGDLAVAQNISLSQPPTEYNLTGYVHVNQCVSVHYENWAGVVISFFDGSLSELGRIYYQFADYGTSGDLYSNEINLYNQLDTWLRFNRNISQDYIDEFSGDPYDITQIELAFFVRVADGTNVGDEGFCEAYYDDWYFDAKNYPLRLVRNEDFAALGFPGSGTELDPYRIVGYEIEKSNTHLIDIEDTNIYFLIENCNLNLLNGYYYGIQFNNVSHGTILENNITNCWRGIEINTDSLYNNVSWNNITSCSQFAIYSTYSNYSIFEGNHIYDGNYGICFTHSYQNIICNNKIYNHEQVAIELVVSKFNILEGNEIYNCSTKPISPPAGILLHSHADNNSIVNNNIHSTGSDWGAGIFIYDECYYNNFSWNTIRNNDGYGIFAESITNEETGLSNSIISHNNISNCRGGAIYLQVSFNNIIQYNTFYNNTDEYHQFNIQLSESNDNTIAYNTFMKNYPIKIYYESSGNNISWNDFIGNSWSEADNSSNIFDSNYYDGYYSTDINAGGYYNKPKTIHQGIEDTHPLTSPYNTDMAFMNYLTYPKIIFPSSDHMDNLVGTITIKWLESYGCPGKTVTYSVYYRDTSTEQSYTQIAAGLTTTQYDWDTTTVVDGSQYEIKVVASCLGLESAEWSVGNALMIWNWTEEPPTEEPTTEHGVTPAWTIVIGLLALTGILIRRKKES